MPISTLADGNMSSPTTAVMCKTHKRSEKPGFCLSTFASVSKPWQSLIERETFNHIKIASHELDLFKTRVRSYRTRLVKHILLEIPYNVSSSGDDDKVQFSKAVHALWRILSMWKTHRVTVELGIFSTEARQLMEKCDRKGAHDYPFNPWKTLNPHFFPTIDAWRHKGQQFLGSEPLGFDRASLSQQSATSLPHVDAIMELVIRREYHPNIAPMTLHEIISSTPCIESIHLERWLYAIWEQDRDWDRAFQQSGLLVPESTKRLAYFEEYLPPYYHWAGGMVIPRLNRTVLESVFHAADRLEHIAVSFAFDAQTFFDELILPKFKVLKTLALTSSFSDTLNDTSESLLVNAAEGVKKMPALRILEIWNLNKYRQADVFRYERLDRRNGQLTWQSTQDRRISSHVKKGWKDLLGRFPSVLDVKCSQFPMEMESLRDILPYLKLREQILRGFTER
ncbi:hypothetical protein LB506_001904 [Fusarium annulatum]|nr:hypothetical protein LB506_001904 [Fusarium annulatum]